jgi:hypothetical protein
LDEHQFWKFQQAPEVQLKDTKTRLTALKEELLVLGKATVEMSNAARTVHTTIIVIGGKIDSPFIRRQTLEMLGMPLNDETGGLKNRNKNIKDVKHKNSKHQTEHKTILDTFEQRFTGIGNAMGDGKEIQIQIPMEVNATQIAQKPRRVPYQLTEPLKKRLEEFQENDIIEPVPVH